MVSCGHIVLGTFKLVASGPLRLPPPITLRRYRLKAFSLRFLFLSLSLFPVAVPCVFSSSSHSSSCGASSAVSSPNLLIPLSFRLISADCLLPNHCSTATHRILIPFLAFQSRRKAQILADLSAPGAQYPLSCRLYSCVLSLLLSCAVYAPFRPYTHSSHDVGGSSLAQPQMTAGSGLFRHVASMRYGSSAHDLVSPALTLPLVISAHLLIHNTALSRSPAPCHIYPLCCWCACHRLADIATHRHRQRPCVDSVHTTHMATHYAESARMDVPGRLQGLRPDRVGRALRPFWPLFRDGRQRPRRAPL